MLAASLERISIGLLLIREYNIFFVREASSPCNGNHFLVISTTHGEAVLFLPACYFENYHTLPLSELYTVYEIAV